MDSMDFRCSLTCDHSPLLCVRMLDHDVRDIDHDNLDLDPELP